MHDKLFIVKMFPNGECLVRWIVGEKMETAIVESLDRARFFAQQIGLNGILL